MGTRAGGRRTCGSCTTPCGRRCVLAGDGRRARLSTLLVMIGLAGKRGAGCDAPALWHTGRLEQLERYCRLCS